MSAMRRGVGLKWNYYDDDVLPAWVAEMDFGLAPSVRDALRVAVETGNTAYPYPDLEESVARAAGEFWRARYGWEVPIDSVFPAPDVIEAIRRAIVHLTRPGSPVVIHSPVYFPFYGMVNRAGRDLIEVPSIRDSDGRYSLDLGAIDRALDDGAGAIILCNPWNPTGRVFDEGELGEVLELAARHDARVIADEIHGAITFDGATHIPMATIDPERTITATSASKAWNLPGLKSAQLVLTNTGDAERWRKVFTPDAVGVGTFGLIASEAAYDGGVGWFDEVLGRLQANRDLLTKLVGEYLPGSVFAPPQGTYLAWVDLSPYGLGDPTRFLLEVARVAVTAGAPFGTGADQFVRFNFATDPDLVVEMMERIGSAIESR